MRMTIDLAKLRKQGHIAEVFPDKVVVQFEPGTIEYPPQFRDMLTECMLTEGQTETILFDLSQTICKQQLLNEYIR